MFYCCFNSSRNDVMHGAFTVHVRTIRYHFTKVIEY